MSKECARYEPVAWWFTRSRIGRDLREQYKVPTELPSELRALIRKLDEIEGYELFREFQRTFRDQYAGPTAGTARLS
jgi:hypothetical protein